MSGKFESLIRMLEKELKLTGTEIAEILWLTLQSPPQCSTSGSDSDSGSSTTLSSTSTTDSSSDSGSDSSSDSGTGSGSDSGSDSSTTTLVPVSPINGEKRTRKSKSTSSLPIKVPDVASLRHPLEIAKALRPLIQYIASGKAVFLDEEATINRIAELEGICIPVLKSPSELRFDLALVIDKSDSMIFWQRTIQELQQLLKHYGFFRNTQTWEMVTAKKEQDNSQAPENIYLRRWTRKKRANHEQKSSSFNLYSPKKLVDPSGRRLILVVSDCVNPIWHNSKALSVLKTWGKHNIVAILQMLPERMWLRTALNLGAMVQLDSRIPAVANRNLYIKEMLIWDDVTEKDLKVPVFCLQPESAETWCEMVAGKSPIGAGGFVFPLDFIKEQVGGDENKSETVQFSSKERVDNFNISSSPLARNLARLLAAAPVINLPIVRLIQRTLLTQSDQVHVAEVFLGGILKPQEFITPETEADQVLYRFIDDDSDVKDEEKIRGLLLSESPKTDSRYIIEVISRYFAKQMGKNLKDFYALLTQRNELEKLKQEKNINEFDVKHFAEISTQVLKHLGGPYAKFAEEIEKQINNVEPIIPPPYLKYFEINVTRIKVADNQNDEPESIELKTFISETVVFVNKRGEIIRREPVEAFYFEEELEKGTDPLKMMRIPAGEFWMGTEEEEIERLVKKFDWKYFRREKPQHKVTIKQDFYMSQTPITQGQWKAVTKLPQVGKKLKENPSSFKGDDNLPVEKVSWYDAIEFCARLSQATGKNYRLPSEAQWEYACRAVSSEIVSNENNEEFNQESSSKKKPASYPPFSFGETITDKLANYRASEIYEEESAGEYRQKTTPVGQFYPNAFGLHDMHGNVWEWCADPGHDNYDNAPTDGSVWDENVNDDRYLNYLDNIDTLLESSSSRVIRGGSWRYYPGHCRSAFRSYGYPRFVNLIIGFRVVCG